MTTNVFNPDLGQVGSAAAPVNPVADRSKMMEAEFKVQQAQDTAQDFNQFAEGLFTLAPVVNEIAAQKYIEKNLQGEDGAGEVDAAGYKTEKTSQDKYDAVTGEMDIQRRFASEDLQTLAGVEEARKQGLIGYSEAMLRARQIRARAIDRAPLWAKQIDAAFRSTVGTGTGTGDIGVSPWEQTPEEKAMQEERKKTAEYAATFNVDLRTADRMRAEDAWMERQKKMTVKNDNDFAAWGNAQITSLRGAVQKTILAQANDNGTFDAETLPKLRQDIAQWEMFAREQINTKIQELQRNGIVPSAATVNRMYDEIDSEVQRMQSYVTDQDAVAFLKNVVEGKSMKVRNYVYDAMPGTMALKEAGHNPTQMLELMLTNGDQFRTFASQNPEIKAALDLMSDEELGAKIYGDVVNVVTNSDQSTPPTEGQLSSVTQAFSVASPLDKQTLIEYSKEQGTYDTVITAVRRDPQSIVSFRNNGQFDKWALDTEVMNDLFNATGAGINTAIMEAVAVGKDPEVRLDFDTAGNPIVTGEGASDYVVGLVNDTYQTILTNEKVWSAYADSPEAYLRQVLPNTVKAPITREMAQDIETLKTVKDPQNVLDVVTTNMDQYLDSEEMVDEVSGILLDNARIAQRSQLSSVAKQLKDLEDQLWNTYLGEQDETDQ